MKKRNLRKTKTDKEDCFNLVNLFLTNTFKEYSKPDQLYLDLNALSSIMLLLWIEKVNLWVVILLISTMGYLLMKIQKWLMLCEYLSKIKDHKFL